MDIVKFLINKPSVQAASLIGGTVCDSLDAEVFLKHFRSSALSPDERISPFFDNAGESVNVSWQKIIPISTVSSSRQVHLG